MTTLQLIQYYAKLLIIQYLGLPRASATIEASVTPIVMAQTDLSLPTLPLAVQDAFNLLGSSPAVGVQLDILGKYAGVTRSGYDFEGDPIILGDADYLQLIKFAVATNNAGSSLSDIQAIFNGFFPPGLVYVFDYQNMHMSYLIDSDLGNQALVQLLATKGLLPKPMGVQLTVTTYSPVIDMFFGFRDYINANPLATPFNTYTDYNLDWPWLTYNDGAQQLNSMLTEGGDVIVQETGDSLFLG